MKEVEYKFKKKDKHLILFNNGRDSNLASKKCLIVFFPKHRAGDFNQKSLRARADFVKEKLCSRKHLLKV